MKTRVEINLAGSNPDKKICFTLNTTLTPPVSYDSPYTNRPIGWTLTSAWPNDSLSSLACALGRYYSRQPGVRMTVLGEVPI